MRLLADRLRKIRLDDRSCEEKDGGKLDDREEGSRATFEWRTCGIREKIGQCQCGIA